MNRLRTPLAVVLMCVALHASATAFGGVFGGSKMFPGRGAGGTRATLLLVGGTIGGATAVLYSSDGVTFTAGTIANAGARAYVTVNGTSTAYAVVWGASASGVAYASTDGKTWAQVGTPTASVGWSVNINRLEYNTALGILALACNKSNDGFATTYACVFTSSNGGATWTERTPASIRGGFYGLGSGETAQRKFVTTGASDVSPFANYTYSTADGITWSADTKNAGAPNGAIYGAGTDGTTWAQTSGGLGLSYAVDAATPLTWVNGGSTAANPGFSLRYLHNVFVLVGSGASGCSTLGRTLWSDITTPAGGWWDVGYFPPTGEWFAVNRDAEGANHAMKNNNVVQNTTTAWTQITFPTGVWWSIATF